SENVENVISRLLPPALNWLNTKMPSISSITSNQGLNDRFKCMPPASRPGNEPGAGTGEAESAVRRVTAGYHLDMKGRCIVRAARVHPRGPRPPASAALAP